VPGISWVDFTSIALGCHFEFTERWNGQDTTPAFVAVKERSDAQREHASAERHLIALSSELRTRNPHDSAI